MKHIVALLFMLGICLPTMAQSHFAKVYIPPIPQSLEFAGESVPLENYDTRESLRRELLTTCYMHSRTSLTLLNTRRYFAIIEPILEEYGIPSDFKYLCMAESGLDPNVVSVAGAAGLWQLMPATGRKYGLDVGSEVDERYHIEKATVAACRHLLESYEQFGSWTLAAAAYNLGDAGVARRIEKQGVDNYYDAFLPVETLRYMFRILSFKLVTESPHSYGYMISSQDYYPPLTDYHEVETNDLQIDWSKFAAANGTTYKMLRELNHWIRDYDYTNRARKTYVVKIPNADFRN